VTAPSDLAARARIDPDTATALAEASDLVAVARRAADALDRGPHAEALAIVGALGTEVGARAPLMYLLAALLQIPGAAERHRRLGVDPAVSDDTFRDLALWCAHFRGRRGFHGITLEILDWSQSYLRGNVFRTGALEWELRESYAATWVFRRGADRRWLIAPGTWLSYGGRHRCNEGEPGARRAGGVVDEEVVRAHPIDVARGVVDLDSFVTLDRAEWTCELSPRSVMLEMHIPEDAGLDLASFVASARRAEKLFARFDAREHEGLFGDAWLLDPQVAALLPGNCGVAALQAACALVPGAIPEAKTVRRLFGPSATRASVLASPRAKMNSLQRAIAVFLEDPAHMLCATCGVVVRDGLGALERVVGG
jgi:hypothetical protein